MTPPVLRVTESDLRDRREAVLRSLGMSLDEFRRLIASATTLTGEEWEAKEELDNIAFLLGEDRLERS